MIKRNCSFLIDRETGKSDGRLRYRIKWDNNKNIVAFSVGYRVEIEKWSKETQRCKNNTTHGINKITASVINREISRYEKLVDDIFKSFEHDDKCPNIDELKMAFNCRNGKIIQAPVDKSFFDIYDEFISGKMNEWRSSTTQKIIADKNRLKKFREDLTFEFFNDSGLSS